MGTPVMLKFFSRLRTAAKLVLPLGNWIAVEFAKRGY